MFHKNTPIIQVQMTCRFSTIRPYIQSGTWSLVCFKSCKTLIKSFFVSTYMCWQSTQWITCFHTDIPLNLWFLHGLASLMQTLTLFFFYVYNFEERLAAHGFSSFSYAVQFHQSPAWGLLRGSTRTKAHGSDPQTRKYLSYIGYCQHCLCLLPQYHLD